MMKWPLPTKSKRVRGLMSLALLIIVLGWLNWRQQEPSTIGTMSHPVATNTSQKQPEKSSHFRMALPGYSYRFPHDHASHPDFKTEWWYYTGHLMAKQANGTPRWFGYELTFFRSATGLKNLPTNSRWHADQFYLAHFALTDEQGQHFYHTQRLNRGAPGGTPSSLARAGADTQRHHVWNDHWSATTNQRGEQILLAATPDITIQLTLTPTTPPIIHGYNGVSQKAACRGCASHYYSYPRLQTQGTVKVANTAYAVSGQSWMDHEFGSNQLQANQVGWDWFSIQLSTGDALMLYVMRHSDDSWDTLSSGTWITRNGQSHHLNRDEFIITPKSIWQSPHTDGKYPSRWEVSIPSRHLTFTIHPVLQDQELTSPIDSALAYWEGRCKVTGKQNDTHITGNAYVELTGYAKPFQQKI